MSKDRSCPLCTRPSSASRAAVTGLGTNAVSSFVMGDEQIVDAYDAALKDFASDPEIVATLTRQKATLLTKIAQMKQMES